MDIAVLLELAAFAVLMGLSAFFSSSETALFSLSRLQLEQLRQESGPRVTLIERLLSQPRHLIVTILIGNELVNVAASVISATLVIQLYGAENKWINLLIMVPVLLLVGEITPKTLAIRHNAAFATYQCRPIDLFARAISPLRWVIRRISDFFITLIVGAERVPASIITQDMVRSLAREAVGEGVLDDEEALYINRIFDLGNMTVREVMTPRSQIRYLPATASLEDAVVHYQRTGHTKVPVRAGTRDAVVGVLYARDLLADDLEVGSPAGASTSVRGVMREAYFVPESKSVSDLFYTFRKRKLSLALTVDEFGGVTGLVTMEDLLECIFGDILSRSELMLRKAMEIEKIGEKAFRIDGAMPLRELDRLIGANFETGEVETAGGLMLLAFGELPKEGQGIVIQGHEFTVLKLARQRISRLSVAPAPLSPEMEAGPAEAVAADGDGTRSEDDGPVETGRRG